jgi:hypothetical protein
MAEGEFTMRDQRRALNEAAFRRINERIRTVNESFAPWTGHFSIVCECDEAQCIEQIAIEDSVYEQVRDDPTLFVVCPGHETPKVETVDVVKSTYLVVRKREGEPAQIATATDPRNGQG